jgi:hypothetical protein
LVRNLLPEELQLRVRPTALAAGTTATIPPVKNIVNALKLGHTHARRP